MTEDEAKTKWCPHVVASHTDPRQAPSQYEREAGVTSPFRHNCIGSACMAWRWSKIINPNYKPELMNVYPQPWPPQSTYIPNDSDGYCGLAGQS